MAAYDLAARFRPLFEQIADGAASRDAERRLPVTEIRDLAAAGFGAVRLPVEAGGAGATIPQLASLLIELAAADPNVAQALRGHFAFVEDRLAALQGPDRERWIARIAAGELIGNAWSETTNTVGSTATRIHRTDDGWRVDGQKFYTTGSIYADWIDATVTGDADEALTALIPAAQDGVVIADDWDGFGQRTTGTGGIVFTAAHVAAGDAFAFDDRFRYQTAFYQLVLLAVLAGVARSIEGETGKHLASRARVYSHGNAATSNTDPQLLALVGELSAGAFAAEAIVARVAEAVQEAADTAADRDSPADRAANVAAEIASAQGQVVLTRLVPRLATDLFDALGASAVRAQSALDRHWRNARTVSSHNPVLFKARIVGEWVTNGTAPTPIWAVGAATPSQRA